MQVASQGPGEHIRILVDDRQGHSVQVAVVGPERRIRVEITGPQGPELRGDFDPWSFEHQLDLMRAHGLDATAGIAGRFQVTAVDDLDTGGHVDWGNGGSVVWIYPNRRGPETDWARFSMDEVLEDFLAIWAVHRVDNA